MNLFFRASEIPTRGRGLTFDDVLLVPVRSDIRSRREPNLQTQLTKKRRLEIPLISANMDTVTEGPMAIAMDRLGGLGILHRFLTPEQQVQELRNMKEAQVKCLAASVGVGDEGFERAKLLAREGVQVLTLDIAHGHSVQMLELLDRCKQSFPDIEVIVGNIATPEAVEDFAKAGADAVKVGIGPGSMCTTRVITGCGVPQLTAIALCSEVARSFQIPVIGDGGLKSSGDIVKAFAAGANSVMLGSLLAGTIETPGEIQQGKKLYRGMASKSAQVSWRGGVPHGMAAEGESTGVWVKGHVNDVVSELTGGIRSGMSYLNANSFEQIFEQARFVEMTSSGNFESRAHGLTKY